MDQVTETGSVHDVHMMTRCPLTLGAYQGVAVVPSGVGHLLAGEITVDHEADHAGEVRLRRRAAPRRPSDTFRTHQPLVVHHDFAGEAERLLLEAADPTVTCPTYHPYTSVVVSAQSVGSAGDGNPLVHVARVHPRPEAQPPPPQPRSSKSRSSAASSCRAIPNASMVG